jgi:DUF4097 and DUF4098 domain-containing protein YvlB
MKMKMMKMTTGGTWVAGRAALLALVLLAGPAAAKGQNLERIEERRGLSAIGRVEIETVHHGVRIERWDRAEVEITGSYDRRYEEVRAEGDAQRFRFRVRPIQALRGSWSTERSEPLRVRVPQGAHVQVKTVSGSLRMDGGQGEIELESVSGAIEVDGSPARARLNSVSGSITFRGQSPDLRVQNVSGALRIEAQAARFEARTVSGSIEVQGRGPISWAEMASVSGTVNFTGALARGAEIKAESHSGSVTMALSGDLGAEYRLSTFSGRIRAELPNRSNEVAERSRFTPDERMSFTIGSGAGRIEARSFSGTVTVRSGG